MTEDEVLTRLSLVVDLANSNMPAIVLKNEIVRLMADITGRNFGIMSRDEPRNYGMRPTTDSRQYSGNKGK